jgi:hypothetical protein
MNYRKNGFVKGGCPQAVAAGARQVLDLPGLTVQIKLGALRVLLCQKKT